MDSIRKLERLTEMAARILSDGRQTARSRVDDLRSTVAKLAPGTLPRGARRHRGWLGFLAALVPCVLACGQSADGDANELRIAIDAVCRKVAGCAETTFDAEQAQECRRTAGMLGLVLPDPESFTDCMRSMDCEDLLNVEDDPSELYACVDLDPSSVRCEGDDLLSCSNGGYCSVIDCDQACAIVGATLEACGESDGYAYEVCRCRL